jgi:hypothetical protein
MSGYNPNRIAAGKSTGGQFAAKVNGEQELDLPLDEVDEDCAMETRRELIRKHTEALLSRVGIKTVSDSLDQLAEKKNSQQITRSEDAAFSRLDAEHKKRARAAARHATDDALKKEYDNMTDERYWEVSRSERNTHGAVHDELIIRNIIEDEDLDALGY